MTKKQIARKEMQETVSSFLDSYTAVWSSIPKIGAFKNELDALNTAIEGAHKAQLDAQVYLGKTKSQLKQIISQKGDIVNDLIAAYAGVEGDAALESRMQDSYTALNQLRNEEFIPRIREIIQEGTDRKEALVDYGLNDEQLTDLMEDLDNYLAMSGQPRLYRVSSSQATLDLETLFTQANELLENRLDKVMKVFKTRNTNFYNGYLAARSIIG